MAEYDPQTIEPKWQSYWEEKRTFRTPDSPGKKKFYCLDFFPFPSGAGLHVGHPLGYIATDILSRFKRMRGYSVLHPMGWDAFGLPAEQHALSTGEHPSVSTERNCANYKRQMRMIGLSYDWEREVATCKPDYFKWTQWIFLKLFNSWFDPEAKKARPIEELPIPSAIKKEGTRAIEQYRAKHRLAYEAEAHVNWCPALGTVLANEEVINGRSERGGHEVVRKPMRQWMLRITKYADRLLEDLEGIDWPHSIKEQQKNWIGKKTGAEIDFKIEGSTDVITAFTTRPDTLFGVTFFVISPEHPLVDRLTIPEFKTKISKYCEEARKMSELARTIENRRKTGVFTGSYVVNPITSEILPVYIGDYVLMNVGTGALMGVPAHDERDFDFARSFQIDIRPVILPDDESAEVMIAVAEGEMAWTGAGRMVPSKAKVFRELNLEGEFHDRAGKKIVKWLVQNKHGREVVTYKLRDWLFSRQRFWGEPIPVVHWEDGSVSSLDESELPLRLPEVSDFQPGEGGESPLARAEEWLKVTEKKTGRIGRRETNTMPNWAGSCWYYLRFIDPGNKERPCDPELEKKWMPVDLYVGGAEHAVLHLLYARFWHKVLFDLGFVSTPEPFKKLFNQGMIQSHAFKDRRGALIPSDQVEFAEDGNARSIKTGEPLERIVAKMSKSLKNVVTPDEIVEEFGADTLRMYEMFMGPLDSSRVWDPKAISGNHRFLKRAWLFVMGQPNNPRKCVSEQEQDASVKKALHKLIKRVEEDLENLQFNTAIAGMMEFLNEVGSAPASKATLEKFTLVLAPFAPHIAEEMWQALGHKESIALAEWPKYDAKLIKEEAVSVVVQINGRKRAVIEVAAKISESDLKDSVVTHMYDTEYKVSAGQRFIIVYQPGTKIPRLVNVLSE